MFFQTPAKKKKKKKNYIIPTLNREQLNTISEVCKNLKNKKQSNNLFKSKKKFKTITERN